VLGCLIFSCNRFFRARYNDSIQRYPHMLSPTKPRPFPAAAFPTVGASGHQVSSPAAPKLPQTAIAGRGRGFSGRQGSNGSQLTPEVMQQLLTLPRGKNPTAGQQQQFKVPDNERHLYKQQVAREHLQQQQQIHQNINRQFQQQPTQERSIWGGMQNIMPTSTAAPITNCAQIIGMKDAEPSVSGLASSGPSSSSTLSPTIKRSGSSVACTLC
jgi:hypothetical protein